MLKTVFVCFITIASVVVGIVGIRGVVRERNKQTGIVNIILSWLGILASIGGLLYVSYQITNVNTIVAKVNSDLTNVDAAIANIDTAIANVNSKVTMIENHGGDMYISIKESSKVEIKESIAESPTIDFAFASAMNYSANSTWLKGVTADVSDDIEIRVEYMNVGDTKAEDVVCKFILPGELEFIPGSLKLYNNSHPAGISLSGDDLDTLNIGTYAPYANAIVKFRVRINSDNLGVGTNILRTWIQIYETNDRVSQDFTDVYVTIAD